MTLLLYHIYIAFSGSEFAVTKLLGVMLTILNSALLYLWLRKFAAPASTIVAVLVTFLIITTEPLYVPSDYHDLVQFFVTVTTILTLRPPFDERHRIWRTLSLDILLGVVAQALFLTKQNIGLFVAAVPFVLMLGHISVYLLRRQNDVAASNTVRLAAYIASFLIAGPLILRLAGVNDGYFSFVQSLVTLQSKGSPFYAATRIFHDSNNTAELVPGVILALSAVFLYFIGRYIWGIVVSEGISVRTFIGNGVPDVFLRFFSAIVVVVASAWAFKYVLDQMLYQDPTLLWNYWPTFFTVAAYLVDVFFTFFARFAGGQPKWLGRTFSVNCARVAMFGAIIFSNSFTAALSILPMVIIFCFYAAVGSDVIFRFIARRPMNYVRAFLFASAAMVTIFTVRLELGKFQVPYSWWGIVEPPIFSSSVPSDLPYLSGLKFAPERAEMLRAIVDGIDANSGSTDPLFTFPDIPVFYMLSHRFPNTRTYVQWFDFATNRSLLPDFEQLSGEPPKVIVQLMIPTWVSGGHAALLGRDLPQTAFSSYLQCMIDKSAFADIQQHFYNETDAVSGTFRVRADRVMSADEVLRMGKIVGDNPLGLALTGAYGLDESPWSIPELAQLVDKNAHVFSSVVIQGKGDSLAEIMTRLRVIPNTVFTLDNDHYVVRLLRRETNWKSNGSGCRSALLLALKSF